MQDNGEIHEDGMAKATLGGGWLDAELRDTFPASDPLSHWAGPPRDLDEADRSQRGRRGAPASDDTARPKPGGTASVEAAPGRRSGVTAP